MTLIFPPFLKDNGESIQPYMEKCEAYMAERFGAFHMKCATDQTVEKIRRDCGGRYAFMYDERNSEYIYNASDLINLTGKKYHSKRNHIHAFLRGNSPVLEAYDEKYKEECLALQGAWAADKGGDGRDAEEEYASIKKALDHYGELEYKGCVVLLAGEVAAFSIGERICPETAVIHIEKAKPGVDGLFAYINREFAANFWSDCTYINREEDMGVPGIRRAKRSYHPAFMLDKYDVLIGE